jgi:hypothetical protein
MRTVRTQFFVPGPVALSEGSSAEAESKEEQHHIKTRPSKSFQDAQEEVEKQRTHQFNQLGKRINTKLNSFLKQLDGVTDDGT